jgi:hypothetical protein
MVAASDIVIDLRNIYSIETMKAHGFRYVRVGRVRWEGWVGRHSGPRRGGLSRVAVHLLDEIAICSRRRAYSPAAAPLQAILLAKNELGNDGCTKTPKVRD